MNIKREYIILFFIIAVLVLYIFLRKENRIQYDIPEISKMDRAEITGIEINTKDKKISIRREGDKWVIGKEKYFALLPMIEDMLDFLERPVLMTVVSESKNYQRYGLDEDSRLLVNAISNEVVERSVEIGVKAEGQRYTFIKMENDHRVYSTKNDLREIFSLELDDIRDKTVISFDINEINNIHLVRKDKELTAIRKEVQEEKKGAEDSKPGSKYIWQSSDGKELDGSVVIEILNEISTLRCLGYNYDKKKEDFKYPENTIRINGKKEYILSVFNKEGDDSDYPVISSESPNPFTISLWKIDNILDKFEKLHGEKEDEKNQ